MKENSKILALQSKMKIAHNITKFILDKTKAWQFFRNFADFNESLKHFWRYQDRLGMVFEITDSQYLFYFFSEMLNTGLWTWQL